MWFLEGLPNRKNMVMEGLCQEMFELIKDRRTKSLVSGTVAKARKGGRSRNARFDYGFESIDD